MKKFLSKIIPKGSVILMITTFLSYFLGLVRDHFFAQNFGASLELDAYNAAFLVPDLFFNILVASGIAAAFIPIVTELRQKNKVKAHEYTNSIITAASITMLITALIVIIFANQISGLVVPGFEEANRILVAKLLRILALSPIFFGISNTLGALLVARQRFLFYGLSPVFYNFGIIGGTIFLAPHFGITGVAFGTVIGAILHCVIRLFDAYRTDFHFHFNTNFKTKEFLQTIRLMLPKMLGHPIELATFWAFTAISSTLIPGSVAVLNFARNFGSVPVSLIGITVATATFPILSLAIAKRSVSDFRKALKKSFLLIFLTSVAAAIFVFLIKQPLIQITLGGGEMSVEDVTRVASTLGVFALSIPTEATVHLLARAFYATKNTWIPVAFGLLGFFAAISSAYFLAPQFGILAMPLGFFAGSSIRLISLSALITLRTKKLFKHLA
ncbi:MAG: polysaccharide biosynthesis C-terminal domain-containing protein [Candidatus Peribacteraceae bacterium]|nr:polysaccharide biosynthesis C-terminal domain-containing protein [Candidatus Peribacteraceae bacterium]